MYIAHRSIADVVLNLQKNLNGTVTFEFVVRRSCLLTDALRRMRSYLFAPNKPIRVSTTTIVSSICCQQVVFVGEDGTDTGGLTREFFMILGTQMTRKYMNTAGTFLHNAVAYQVYCQLI